ncbi:MAG TPA: undecaprenyl-phosphate glucose phosphotransferase [bacterium]|nr:undecaprenyl-phosphate glucose phosphotransferase [bacterium]
MKLRLPSLFSLISFVLDGSLVAGSFLLANWLRFDSGLLRTGGHADYPHYRSFLLFFVIVHLVAFKYMGLYRSRRGISGVDELSKVFLAALAATIVIAACTFLVKFFAFSRLVIGFSAGLIVAGVWTERTLLRRVQVVLRRRGIGVTRVLVAGTGETARVLLQRIRHNPGLGYRVIGVVSEGKRSGEVEGHKVLGPISRFTAILQKTAPEEVIFALPAPAHGQLVPLLVALQATQTRYKIVSDLFGLITNPVESDVLMGMPIFEMKEAPLNAWHNRAIKRTFDLVLSLVGIVLLSPVWITVAIGIKLTSPGPVLFHQKRVGKDGRVFHMRKFRSMSVGSETVAFTKKNDPRVTPFGAFLRKTSLDEIPQLLNVVTGRMSLVGPRPEVPGLVEKFHKEIPRYFERHQVKSGITGWAQVNGLRGNTSLEERVKYDIYYIENWSLLLDIKILARTVLDILEHEHAY